jgi:penicillin-binding protein-related factor A (putative recombinase)
MTPMMQRSRQIPRVRYRHWIFKLPFVRRYRGMVVGRTILFKGGETEITPALLQHELVHWEQIDRHGITCFYLIYFRDYLANLWRLRNHDAAYRHIPFEKESCERERDYMP